MMTVYRISRIYIHNDLSQTALRTNTYNWQPGEGWYPANVSGDIFCRFSLYRMYLIVMIVINVLNFHFTVSSTEPKKDVARRHNDVKGLHNIQLLSYGSTVKCIRCQCGNVCSLDLSVNIIFVWRKEERRGERKVESRINRDV